MIRMRKYYIDNLRWFIIMLLIPFHAAQAFKTWDEPNYIVYGPNAVISSVIVFFAPFVMQILFLFAGMSIRYALKKRSYGQFAAERVKRLLIPLLFGVLILVPPMTYLADCYHNGYDGSYFSHYIKFFTLITDMSGADGGFSFGQFWFLLYLFILSFVLLGVVAVQKKVRSEQGDLTEKKGGPLWLVVLMGLPLPVFSELLSVGGKSFVEFLYFLLLGYYVFTNEKLIEEIRKYAIIFLAIGLAASILNVYLFLFSGAEYPVLNTAAKYVSEWFMVLAFVGVGKRICDREFRVTGYLSKISYPFFSFHFVFVILFQYIFSDVLMGNVVLLYLIPVALSFAATFLCCHIVIHVPALCFLVGVKKG